jgi:pyridoxal phosphate enzyme (YggS family)
MEAATGHHPGTPAPVLIAAAKTQPAERVAALIAAGVGEIGENRVQEAQAKRPAVEALGARARWHLIGPLQSNKAREAVEVFEVIHTIDRPKIAQAVAREAEALGKTIDCFVQVNIGREAQKHGLAIEALPALLACVRGLPSLRLQGLMAVPPAEVPPAPYFALLAELARREELSGLSMGMSGDFETAIRLGATHVRIGTALFGLRET